MSDDGIAYVGNIRIERIKGTLRRAYLPAETEPVYFSVHSEIAEHYGVKPGTVEAHAATIDYLIAAAGG